MMYDKAKAEVDVLLASANNDYEKRTINDECAPILAFCKAMDESILTDTQKEGVIKRLFNFVHTGLLSALTLRMDEFYNTDILRGRNKRYASIYIAQNNIYNDKAFKVFVRTTYFHPEMKQTSICEYDTFADRIYLSKGGVITGEYISDCKIKESIIKQGNFEINDIIKIPVALIVDNDYILYAVDHREPKIKLLNEIYETQIHIDTDIKGKYNIRNYKKLEK